MPMYHYFYDCSFTVGCDSGCYSNPSGINGLAESTVSVSQSLLGSVHPLLVHTTTTPRHGWRARLPH